MPNVNNCTSNFNILLVFLQILWQNYNMKKYIILLFIVLVMSIIASPQNRGDFCGTPAVLEEYRAGRLLPVRPTMSGPELFIDRTNFRLHYTMQGSDAVSVAYAESCASAMSYSWSILVDNMGFTAPPPDFGQGGDDRYDIYLKVLSSGVAGVTYPEYSYSTPYPDGVCSHIRIAVDMDINYMKSTVTHEFMHSIQFRYSSVEGTWWMENGAVWSEDVVYDAYNDYLGFLSTSPNPLANPELSITNGTNLYWYAGGIWAMFLCEYYNDLNIIKQIWTYQGQVAGQNALSGIDYILNNQYSSSLVTALTNYSIWRYFTGFRADTIHYFSEGHLFPTSRILSTHVTYPVSGNQGSYPVANVGGTNFIQFQNGGGKFSVSFNAQSLYRWKCNIVKFYSNYNTYVYELPLNSSGAGADSFDWSECNHFALIPVLLQWEYNTGAQGFSYAGDLRILHDVGVLNLTGYTSIADSGSVVTLQTIVKNYGLSAENFGVRLVIGTSYMQTQNLSLNAGDSTLVTFAPCTLRNRNYNAVLCTTLLATDERSNNNSITDRIMVRVKNVAVTQIIQPSASIAQGSYIHPKARIKNYGNVREIFYVDFRIGDWVNTQRISLNADMEFDLEWDSIWHPTDTGNFVVKCSTKLANDVQPNNDWMTANCYVYPAAIYESNIFTLKQPSCIIRNNRVILSNIENINTVKFEMFDVQGRNVYRVMPKAQSFNINKSLPSGCYIVRMQADNKNIIDKSVIIR